MRNGPADTPADRRYTPTTPPAPQQLDCALPADARHSCRTIHSQRGRVSLTDVLLAVAFGRLVLGLPLSRSPGPGRRYILLIRHHTLDLRDCLPRPIQRIGTGLLRHPDTPHRGHRQARHRATPLPKLRPGWQRRTQPTLASIMIGPQSEHHSPTAIRNRRHDNSPPPGRSCWPSRPPGSAGPPTARLTTAAFVRARELRSANAVKYARIAAVARRARSSGDNTPSGST